MSEQRAKILIVDDRPENIHAMKDTLAPMNVEMIAANSGSEALKLVLQHDFSLVLMDVQMPEMDGFETAALMQKNATTRSVPIIFVTAINKDAQHEYKGYEAGAVDYIFKPVNPDILFSKVRVFVNLHEMRLDNERMQQEMLKGRNLESLGLLAGGIAHEFNNLLTAIMGNVEVALLAIEPENIRVRSLLLQSQKASTRAKKLASKLLTFARGGDPVKRRAKLDEIVRDEASFILQGSKTACQFEFGTDLLSVGLDTGQFGQAIQNIIINANQAMPNGGIISIRAENVHISDNDELSLPAGNYVKLAIHDQGCGIAPEHLEKVFDPYFTTGECGHGLGLAITHSIIKKHGGHIRVQSELGAGTTMNIYLPAMTDHENDLVEDTVAQTAATEVKPGKVLVMDDEEAVGQLVVMILATAGYETVVAKEGREALEMYQKYKESGDPVSVVIMDLTIPGGMGGEDTIGELLAIDPNAKAIVASGYANDPVMSNYRDYGFVGMLSKPFDMKGIIKAVKDAA